jgi:peptide/nickel transport system substrate-binding protein
MLDTARFGSLVHSDPEIGSLNIGGFRDAEVDRLVEAVEATPDAQARTEVLDELQAAIAEQRPFVTLYYEDGAYAYRDEVYGGWVFQAGQGVLNKLSFVDLDGLG